MKEIEDKIKYYEKEASNNTSDYYFETKIMAYKEVQEICSKEIDKIIEDMDILKNNYTISDIVYVEIERLIKKLEEMK